MKYPVSPRRRGFTLIELIVVIGIIVIIATYVIPNVPSILRGSQMTQAAQLVTDQISYARQQALARNHAVEVRFLRFADPEQPGEDVAKPETGQFRALQIMDVPENGVPVPLSKVQRLPQAIVMNDGENPKGLSTLLAQTATSVRTTGGRQENQNPLPLVDASKNLQNPELPRGVQRNYEYVAFRFLPDGSTNLKFDGNWFVTLHEGTDQPKLKTEEDIGKINFFTLQVDPVTGATKTFRPHAG